MAYGGFNLRKMKDIGECYQSNSTNAGIVNNGSDYFPLYYSFNNYDYGIDQNQILMYTNGDILVSGVASLYDNNIISNNTSGGTKICMYMRVNGYNGIVKWTSFISIKDTGNLPTIDTKEVSSNDIVFSVVTQQSSIFLVRVNGLGVAFQIIGFERKQLNYILLSSDINPISTTQFVLKFLTDLLNHNMSVSSTSGSDMAFMLCSYDLTVNYTLMIDFGGDTPDKTYKSYYQNYTYMLYQTSNNLPQLMIKHKTDLLSGLNYTSIANSTSCCSFGPLCIPYCGASYKSGELPIVKYLKVTPTSTESANYTKYNILFDVVQDTISIYWFLGSQTHNLYQFDIATLSCSKSYIVALSGFYVNKISYYSVKNFSQSIFELINTNSEKSLAIVDLAGSTVKFYNFNKLRFNFFNSTGFNFVSYSDSTSQIKGLILIKYNKSMDPLSSCFPSLNTTNQTFSSTGSTCNITVYSSVPSNVTIKVVATGLLIFNMNYSPYPKFNATYNLDFNSVFNPQPYLGSSGGVCQIDYPKLALSTYEIHLSNSPISIAPFYSCQDIPMNITILSSSYQAASINEIFSISGQSLIIYGQNLQVTENPIQVKLNAKLKTYTTVDTNATINLITINASPQIQYKGDTTLICAKNQTLTLKFVVTDSDDDDIFSSAILSSSTSPAKLNANVTYIGDDYSIDIKAGNGIEGIMKLRFEVWDQFHINSTTFINITIYFSINDLALPHFQIDLPTQFDLTECDSPAYSLPAISNPKNKNFTLSILGDNVGFLMINSSILIRILIDQNQSNYYPVRINLKQAGLFTSKDFEGVFIEYLTRNKLANDIPENSQSGSRILHAIRIKDYLNPSVDTNFEIQINSSYSFIYIDNFAKRIDIINFSRERIGKYQFNVSLANKCNGQTFNKKLNISLLDNQTPAVVEKPKNTIIYQGQRSFSFVIPTNLFYDPKDTFSIYVSPCYYGDTIITNNYDTQPDDYNRVTLQLNSKFVGNCTVDIYAIDSIKQTTLISMDIIMSSNCEQSNNSCNICSEGFTWSEGKLKCIKDIPSLEVICLLFFIIVCILLLLMTNYKFNMILMFLETLQIFYFLFKFVSFRDDQLQRYFDDFTFLSFNVQGAIATCKRLFISDSENFTLNDLLSFYPEIIPAFVLFLIFNAPRINWLILFKNIFRKSSFFMFWLYLTFQFIILAILRSLINVFISRTIVGILSMIASILFLIMFGFIYYCCVLLSNSYCIFCSKFKWDKYIKPVFCVYEDVHNENLSFFVTINLIRKIIISIFTVIGISKVKFLFLIGSLLMIQAIFIVIRITKCFQRNVQDNIFSIVNEFVIFIGFLVSFTINNSYNSLQNNDFHSNTVTVFLYGVKIYIIIIILLEVIKIHIYTCIIIKRKYTKEKLSVQVCHNSNEEDSIVPGAIQENPQDVGPEGLMLNENNPELN